MALCTTASPFRSLKVGRYLSHHVLGPGLLLADPSYVGDVLNPAAWSRCEQVDAALEECDTGGDRMLAGAQFVVADHRAEWGVPVARLAGALAIPWADVKVGLWAVAIARRGAQIGTALGCHRKVERRIEVFRPQLNNRGLGMWACRRQDCV